MHRMGLRGAPPTVQIAPSRRTEALEELARYAWWQEALAVAQGDVAAACRALLRERADPLSQLAAEEWR